MSDKKTAYEFNLETGQEIIRDLNESELASIKELQDLTKKLEQEANAKAKARESALSKLAKLGLTEEEIASL
jgi:hypothetical protein